MLTAAALGFAVGLRHALDPDHVAAVSAVAARHRSVWKICGVGASWGLGHSATLLLAGFAVIALRLGIPTHLTTFAEVAMGFVLIGLGIVNLAAARATRHAPPQRSHGGRRDHARAGALGVAHGLAGSAAITLAAVAAAPEPAQALAYLAAFAAGTVVGMVAFTAALGLPLARISNGGGHRKVVACTGLVSIVAGALLVYEFGFAGTAPLG